MARALLQQHLPCGAMGLCASSKQKMLSLNAVSDKPAGQVQDSGQRRKDPSLLAIAMINTMAKSWGGKGSFEITAYSPPLGEVRTGTLKSGT